MSIVYSEKTIDRIGFTQRVCQLESIRRRIEGKSVLIKPNMVSYEPYPTTTHVETVETLIRLLKPRAKSIVVGDGKAFDCNVDIKNYMLSKLSETWGVEFLDFSKTIMVTISTQSGFNLELSSALSNFDFIISLPVLKFNFSTGLTGALKNQYGFLSNYEKEHLHHSKDKNIHKAIAELSRIRKPDFYIIDAIKSMISAQEIRHGGKPAELGFMFAGTDPVSLDAYGFDILKTVEKKLNPLFRKPSPTQILHLKYAADFGIGHLEYNIRTI